MIFDPDNPVIQICAQGMAKEGEGKPGEAKVLFLEAWGRASNDFEKFIAAHYIARHQDSITDKLEWDKMALHFALTIKDESVQAQLPSLYLNIAKCYEDLNDRDMAKNHYQLALSYTSYLPEDGYGKMIKAGIEKGLERIGSK